MRETKLIFVDGLPGLGKTTTASWLAARLRSERTMVNLLLESQPGHPINVGGDLFPAGDTPGERFFQHYTPESFIQESLERWEAFVHGALQADAISVLDGYPFQNTIRILLQLNATPDSLQEYFDDVDTLALPLQPVLVYFSHRDNAHMLRHFADISAQRGQMWTDYVVTLITHCPYAITRHLSGISGVQAFMTDYKQIIDGLVNQSRLPRLVLGDCAGGWAGCYQQIGAFMGWAKGP